MTLFALCCMFVIGFLSGVIAIIGFTAYLEVKAEEERAAESEFGPEYMSRIDTPEGIEYHAKKH